MNINFKTVDDYLQWFDPNVKEVLQNIRTIIIDNAAGVVEGIAYGMPAYKLHGKPLVYFSAFKNHIGFYATPTGHEKFKKELSTYKQGKGSVQFPLDQPIPYDLVKKIVAFRVKENSTMIKNKTVK